MIKELGIREKEYWSRIAPLVEQEGLVLFDLELPNSKSGVLRVYISSKQGGITHHHCVMVSKRIAEIQDLPVADLALEVSSPGVNRRLRLLEHFRGAVGERIKMKVDPSLCADALQNLEYTENKVRQLRGKITFCDETQLEFQDERSKKTARFPVEAIAEARVDFF